QRVTELRTARCEIDYAAQSEPDGPGDARASRLRLAPAAPGPADDGPAPLQPLLDWALRALASVGALTYGGGHATLTALGRWAVWVKLEQIRVAAQSPAGNIEQGAEDMLRGCAQPRPSAARAASRAWPAAPSAAPSPN